MSVPRAVRAAVNVNWMPLRSSITDAEFKSKLHAITDDTVIPFLIECGYQEPDEWVATAQGVLEYLCMVDERIEKTLFAALHEYIRARAVQDDMSGAALVCNECGEAFDDLLAAKEHGVSNPQAGTWCGDNGFSIMSRKEAF